MQQFASTQTLQKDNQDELFVYNKRAFGPFLLSFDEIRPLLLNPDLKDTAIIKNVHEISMNFTQQRDQIHEYVENADLVSSYTALYLPTNIPKMHFLLSKLSDEVLSDLEARPFIDIGCGPGTFSLAWRLLMGERSPVMAVDQSPLMLEQAQKIMQGFFAGSDFKTARRFHEKCEDGILFFGHSINEMGIEKALDLVMTVDPEYVMWIEPGTSELFTELKKLRAFVLDHYEALYPCPASSACPADWCHQVLRMAHDPSIERLSQLASLDRKILPMTAHLYRRKKTSPQFDPTLIQYITETKFSFEYEACCAAAPMNELKHIELQKKELGKLREKQFKRADVGERLKFFEEKNIGKKIRVKI